MLRCNAIARALIAATAVCLAASPALAAGADPAMIAEGKAIVTANCSRCHAVTRTDKSAHPQAPAFRTLSRHYPVADIEEALVEGIVSGHPDMPEFVLTPLQAHAVVLYLQTIQD
ncbi:cytochrome c [Jiella sp. M17.18]|uniref:c-type cytochrome n=1 Tax=Jiella sp. M17.18 TaxID=3234247 RepID=UPI0034E0336E